MRESRRRPRRRDLAFGIVVGLAVVAIALPLAFWLFGRSDKVPTEGPSMLPTLRGFQELDVDFDAYDDASPKPGEIVALQGPEEVATGLCDGDVARDSPCGVPSHEYGDQFLIKRVVAGPGDTIAIAGDGGAIVNGRKTREPYMLPCDPVDRCRLPRPIRVPSEHFFVLGDNRPNSTDSREWGPIAADAIDGRVVLDN